MVAGELIYVILLVWSTFERFTQNCKECFLDSHILLIQLKHTSLKQLHTLFQVKQCHLSFLLHNKKNITLGDQTNKRKEITKTKKKGLCFSFKYNNFFKKIHYIIDINWEQFFRFATLRGETVNYKKAQNSFYG